MKLCNLNYAMIYYAVTNQEKICQFKNQILEEKAHSIQVIGYEIEAGRNNRQFALLHKHFFKQNSELFAP